MRFLLLTPLLAGAFAAHAADPLPLPDPTRPPTAAAMAAGGVEPGNRLSSVVLPKRGRASAIIGGQLVPVGGMVGESRLVRVTESEAVLEGPEGRERLFLTPDVEKTKVNKAAVRHKKELP